MTQKLGGVFVIIAAFIYISTFILYGGILVYPNATTSTAEKLNYLPHFVKSESCTTTLASSRNHSNYIHYDKN
ncbi:MAG: hypothetical protein ACJA1Z_002153 [Patiriisocius sp.]|jgi:hypothetical protein